MAALDALPVVEKTSLFGTAVHAVLRDRRRRPERRARPLWTALAWRCPALDAVAPSLEDVFLDVVDRVGAAEAPA